MAIFSPQESAYFHHSILIEGQDSIAPAVILPSSTRQVRLDELRPQADGLIRATVCIDGCCHSWVVDDLHKLTVRVLEVVEAEELLSRSWRICSKIPLTPQHLLFSNATTFSISVKSSTPVELLRRVIGKQ